MVKKIIGGCLLTAIAASANADIIEFQLADHPDGNQAPPPYGLRLDGLFSGSASDVYTFEFVDVMMQVDTDADTASITGSVFGGLNDGNGYSLAANWFIDFFVTDLYGGSMNSDGTFVVANDNQPQQALNFGNLTLQAGQNVDFDGDNNADADLSQIGLVGFMGFNFLANDHRCGSHPNCGPLVGEGWLNHTVEYKDPNDTGGGFLPGGGGSDPDLANHIAASDFLFTVESTPVPAPAPLVVFGVALLGLGLRSASRRL